MRDSRKISTGGTKFYLEKFKMILKEFNFFAQANGEENETKDIKIREKDSECRVLVQILGSCT